MINRLGIVASTPTVAMKGVPSAFLTSTVIGRSMVVPSPR